MADLKVKGLDDELKNEFKAIVKTLDISMNGQMKQLIKEFVRKMKEK